MKYRIGVDPGLSGCVVVMDGEQYVDHLQMPVIKTGKSGRVDARAVVEWLADTGAKPDQSEVFIELVGAMPGDAGSTMFVFGRGVGAIEAVFMGLGYPVELVAPASWKRRAGILKAEKDASRSACVMKFPTVKDLRLKAKGQALGDAILIALHGKKPQ